MPYDHTAYPVPHEGNPKRQSTLEELTVWMNKLAISVGSGVHHTHDNGRIHYTVTKSNGKVTEKGIL